MQLITVLSTASALIAGASARSAVQLNESCDKSKPYARVINRCPYDVYLWSVFRGDGCPTDQMVTLKSGETYSENYQTPENGVGISIKLSKTQQCKHQSLTQLEYYLETSKPGFSYNYLDVSYVDCQDNDCPTRQEGYYLQSGSQTGAAIASAGNTWCPILSCNDQASCNKCSYVNPDDVQTKTCDLDQNMDFYMCGGEAPNGDDYSAAPSSSSSSSSSESEKPAPTSAANYGEKVVEAAAAVTPAPAAEAKTHTHTEIVYATVYEYVNAKRHAHGHARRHQNFHA